MPSSWLSGWGVGLASHVLGLQGASLLKKEHNNLYLSLAPVDVCLVSTACSAIAELPGQAFVRALVSVLSGMPTLRLSSNNKGTRTYLLAPAAGTLLVEAV